VRKAAATCECFGVLIVLELVRSISLMVDLAGHGQVQEDFNYSGAFLRCGLGLRRVA
jgi:hypothetical protein